MSKAFVNEDHEREMPDDAISFAPIFGSDVYLTWDGADRMRHELSRLKAAIKSEEHHEDMSLVRRIRRLEHILGNCQTIPPPHPQKQNRIQLGAWVCVEEEDGTPIEYRIVGTEEVNLENNWISWISPIAKALLNKTVGDIATVQLPSGFLRLKVRGISYGTIDNKPVTEP